MSDTFTFPTVTAELAQQSDNNPGLQGSTPPLLPAFLITGVLLAAIVFIIVWRHLVERRNQLRDDDPTWPLDGIIGTGGGGNNGGGGWKGPPPKLWDLKVTSKPERTMWGDIMPLSATALRAAPKPARPKYLVPSDQPVSFFTRMFGGERRPLRPPRPPISLLMPTQPQSPVPPLEHIDEEPIDRLQVAVLISLPHPRRARRASYLPEKIRENDDVQLPPSEKGAVKGLGEAEGDDGCSADKGKKRSLETPISYAYDSNLHSGYDDEEVPSEVAFGTVIIPYVEDE